MAKDHSFKKSQQQKKIENFTNFYYKIFQEKKDENVEQLMKLKHFTLVASC